MLTFDGLLEAARFTSPIRKTVDRAVAERSEEVDQFEISLWLARLAFVSNFSGNPVFLGSSTELIQYYKF